MDKTKAQIQAELDAAQAELAELKAKADAPVEEEAAPAPATSKYAGTFHAAHACEMGHICNCLGNEPGHECDEDSLKNARGIAPHHRFEDIDPDSIPPEFRGEE